MNVKHIFITGGVVSSLGKGITAAALALLLEKRGYRVAMQKLDPYFNVDPGTMNPYQHGEVFVTADGAETDLDLGHYERIAGIDCTKESNFTSGKIYSNVIARERAGGYLGGTVQVIPHITDEIKAAMRSLHRPDVDIAITEIGGTAGDIESLPFLEAARQFRLEAGRNNALFLHLTLVPYIRAAGELKTKPSQHSVAVLRGIGITPDLLVCRTEMPLEEEHLRKLALFCNLPRECVIEERDVRNTIHEVPLELAAQKLDEKTLELLNLEVLPLDLDSYRAWLDDILHPTAQCIVAVVGKYVRCQDAYKSVYEALHHAGFAHHARIKIRPIDAEDFETGDPAQLLKDVDAMVIPGGFGNRGVAGKIIAAGYARKHALPCLGICLGMQCMVIEFARTELGWHDANSTEFDPETAHPVIDLMDDQRNTSAKGGTMRLGGYVCRLDPASRCAALYGGSEVVERHRHRYEFNPMFRTQLEEAGLRIAGTTPDGKLAEIVEPRNSNAYYIGCQFHPEFRSRPRQPHPLFDGLIAAALKNQQQGE